MDWLIVIGGGLFIGLLFALVSVASNWADEARKAGAYKRGNQD